MSRFPEPLRSLFNTGYLAVGVFFTLSGFVLAYNYSLGETWSLGYSKRFAVARFARIYPAYCIGLLLSAPWVAVSLAKHFSVMPMCKEFVKAALTWTLLQAWIPQTANAWNNPGWSLSVEAFFYCSFPVLGVALWKLSRPSSLLTAGLVIWMASLLAPLIAVCVPLMGADGVPGSLWTRDSVGLWVNFLKYNPALHIPEFCMGIVVCRLYHLLRSKDTMLLGRGYWLYLPGMFLEVWAIVRYQSTLYPFLHNGLLMPLHALVILGFALDGGILARLLSLRPLVLFGNASYSMYIFHGVVGDWISLIAKRLFSTELVGFSVTIFYIVFVICFSTVVFKIIEEPANRILRKKLTSWFEASRQKSARQVIVEPPAASVEA